MATLAIQTIDKTGEAVTYASAAAGGDQFLAGTNRALRVKTVGTAITVTIVSQRACDQGSTHSFVVSVGTNTTKEIGGLDPKRFADSNGYVQVTYSAVTATTVAAVETT